MKNEIKTTATGKPAKYICRDCGDWALQFTGSGKAIQVEDKDADQFGCRADAEAALDRAGEAGGWVDVQD